MLHHVELWVPDLSGSVRPWGWLLNELGWIGYQEWPGGRSWWHEGVYLVLEQSPAMTGHRHDRLAPGLNHIAFTAADRSEVDRLTADAPDHGWTLLFADHHPHAGGPDSYAAYFADDWGFEVELQAGPPTSIR